MAEHYDTMTVAIGAITVYFYAFKINGSFLEQPTPIQSMVVDSNKLSIPAICNFFVSTEGADNLLKWHHIVFPCDAIIFIAAIAITIIIIVIMSSLSSLLLLSLSYHHHCHIHCHCCIFLFIFFVSAKGANVVVVVTSHAF